MRDDKDLPTTDPQIAHSLSNQLHTKLFIFCE